MDRVLANARKIGRVRWLGSQPPEIALAELGPLLTIATADAVLREVIMATRSFGTQAIDLLPAIQKLADHPDGVVRTLAESAIKRIRGET